MWILLSSEECSFLNLAIRLIISKCAKLQDTIILRSIKKIGCSVTHALHSSFHKWLNTQIENIPANISSETSGLTWRHVKSGRAHCALLIFSFMLLKVVSILWMKRKTLCLNGSYEVLLTSGRILLFWKGSKDNYEKQTDS